MVTGEATPAVASLQEATVVPDPTLASTAVERVTDLLSATSPESQETLPASNAVRRVTCPENAPTSSREVMAAATTPEPATTVDSQDISPETALPSLAVIPQAVLATTAVKLVTSAETAPSLELREDLVDTAAPADIKEEATDPATTAVVPATSAETALSQDLEEVATAAAVVVLDLATIAVKSVISPEIAQPAAAAVTLEAIKRLSRCTQSVNFLSYVQTY